MDIQLYNTRTRKLESLEPLKPNEVGLYTCGPTVYWFAQLGNMRAYVFADLLRRVLEYNGLAVKHVMNITDVGHLVGDGDAGEDKVERSAKEQGKSAWEIASYYTDAFLEDVDRLNIRRAHVIAKATAHIPEQIALIVELEAKGYTYRTSDGIYFDTAKFSGYGPLSGQPIDELLAGARVEVNPEKRHPHDFALWKFSRVESRESKVESRRQMEWESPWGVGFPGWHIECSAMSVKYLGQPFDIHTGGEDHIFPHHSNEVAQSEAAAGKPLANYWLHNAFLTVDGGRMGKSEGNAYTLQDLVDRGHDPLAFRYFALQAHYRSPLNFTWEALAAAEKGLQHLREQVRQLPKAESTVPTELEEEFRRRINHDLGSPQALAYLHEVLASDRSDSDKASAVAAWDQIFGLGLAELLGQPVEIPDRIAELAAERQAAREAGEYERADTIRSEIEAEGFTVRDTDLGPEILPRAS